MRQFSRTWLGLGCVALLASACGGDDTEVTSDTAASAETSVSTVDAETEDSTTTTTTTAAESTTSTESTTTTAAEESTSTSSTESAQPESDDPSGSVGDVEPATGNGPIESGLQPLIDDAASQLAAELGVEVSEITVESARLASWGNSAAGCPEKDMQYLQVITEGSAIELVHGGSTYWYHSGGQRGLFKCESALRETPPGS